MTGRAGVQAPAAVAKERRIPDDRAVGHGQIAGRGAARGGNAASAQRSVPRDGAIRDRHETAEGVVVITVTDCAAAARVRITLVRAIAAEGAVAHAGGAV